MSEPAALPWTVERFFAWQATQRDRYELVGGVPLRMMAGARNVHDDIVVNLLAELRRQLRGTDCRPFTSDGSVATLPGQIRRPDAGVDCGRRDPDAMQAALPKLVAEVLSPTTRDFDTFEKLGEYRQVASIDDVLVIEPNAPEVVLFSRDAAGAWTRSTISGLDGTVSMPGIGILLALNELYDGVSFPARPRLVRSIGDTDPPGTEMR